MDYVRGAIGAATGPQWHQEDPSKASTPEERGFDGHALFLDAWDNAMDPKLLKLIVATAMIRLEDASAQGKFEIKLALPREVNRKVYTTELEKAFDGRGVRVRYGHSYSSSYDLPGFTFTLLSEAQAADAAQDKKMLEVD